MVLDLKIMELLKDTSIMDAQFEDGPAKSLKKIESIVVESGLNVVGVYKKTETIPKNRGPHLYLCTPEGTVVVTLNDNNPTVGLIHSAHQDFGNLPRKPEGYKDGFRVNLPPSEGQAPLVVSPVIHTPYYGGLPRKPRY